MGPLDLNDEFRAGAENVREKKDERDSTEPMLESKKTNNGRK